MKLSIDDLDLMIKALEQYHVRTMNAFCFQEADRVELVRNKVQSMKTKTFRRERRMARVIQQQTVIPTQKDFDDFFAE